MKRAFLLVWSTPWLAAVRSRDFAARFFTVLACAAVIGITGWQVQLARDVAMREARVQGANLVKSVAEHANASFSLVDIVLGTLADEIKLQGVSQDLFARAQRSPVELVAGGSHVEAFAAYSAAGLMLTATSLIGPDLPVQLAPEELAFHRSHPSGALLLGSPNPATRPGRRLITVSRRFDLADGGFGGIILALVDTDGFEDLYRDLRVGPLGAMGLMRQDGQLLTRVSNFGAAASESAALLGYRQHGFAGNYDIASPADGMLRLASLRVVDGYPLVAFVALAETDVLAAWRSDALYTWFGTSMLTVALAGFGWLLAGQIKRAEAQLRAANTHLQRTAMQDPLTGIGNRRLLDGVLQKEQRRAARTEQPLALLMLDVDHFKSFNDNYGHPAGDACLQRIASAIARSAQRPADLVARFGGEEFAILLPETGTAGAVAIAERAQEAIRQLRIAHCGGLDGIVTVSIGVAVVWPQPPDGADNDLVQLADTALYAAKAQGRNCACVSPLDATRVSQNEVTTWFRPRTQYSGAKR